MLLPVILLFLLVVVLKLADYKEKRAYRQEMFSDEGRPALSSMNVKRTDDYLRNKMLSMARDDLQIEAKAPPVSSTIRGDERERLCKFVESALNETTGFDFVTIDVNSAAKQEYSDFAVYMVDLTMHDLKRYFSRQFAATVISAGKSLQILRVAFSNDDSQDALEIMSSDVGIDKMETPAPWVNIYDITSKRAAV